MWPVCHFICTPSLLGSSMPMMAFKCGDPYFSNISRNCVILKSWSTVISNYLMSKNACASTLFNLRHFRTVIFSLLSKYIYVHLAFISALYSILFTENIEAAFSNYKLWESTGFIISFLYSSYICVAYKIIILLSVLTLGMLGYMIVEFRATRVQAERLLEDDVPEVGRDSRF